jgi:hypothetical protein
MLHATHANMYKYNTVSYYNVFILATYIAFIFLFVHVYTVNKILNSLVSRIGNMLTLKNKGFCIL